MKRLLALILIFLSIWTSGQPLVPFLKDNGKYIFVEYGTMNPVIKQEFDSRPEIFIDDYLVVTKDGKSILIDKKGEEFLSNYEAIEGYRNGVAIVVLNNKRGLATIKGDLLFQPKYDRMKFLLDNLYAGYQNYQMELIDTMGNKVFPVKYDKIKVWNSESLVYSFNGKSGMIDFYGKEILPPIFDEHEIYGSYSHGLIMVKSDGWIGYKNNMNETVIPLIYEDGRDFQENLASVKYSSLDDEILTGYIDTTGNLVISIEGASRCYSFSEGYASVFTEDGYCMIDKNGDIRIIFAPEVRPDNQYYNQSSVDKFERMKSNCKDCRIVKHFEGYGMYGGEGFHEGLAALKMYKFNENDGDGVAYINKSGELIFLFDKCRSAGTNLPGNNSDFYKGFAALEVLKRINGNSQFYIDKEGREYIER